MKKEPTSLRPSPARWAFLSLTVLCVGLAGARLFGVAPAALSWTVWGGLWLIWVAFSTVGVFFPALQMYAPILQRGPSGRGEVALTFDDGPHPVTTHRVLDQLRGTRHRATFFVLADKVRRHPDVVRAIHADGHTLAIHGAYHDRLHSFRWPTRVVRELTEAQDVLQATVGVRPRLFRPPLGHTSPLTARGVARLGLQLIGWSARGYDGLARSSPERVLQRVVGSLCDGAIVLLHDAAERDDFEPASLSVLPDILRELDSRGLRSVGLNAWL